jgi:hypothetical protein
MTAHTLRLCLLLTGCWKHSPGEDNSDNAGKLDSASNACTWIAVALLACMHTSCVCARCTRVQHTLRMAALSYCLRIHSVFDDYCSQQKKRVHEELF